MSEFRLNAQAVAAFWQNRSQPTSLAPDTGRSQVQAAPLNGKLAGQVNATQPDSLLHQVGQPAQPGSALTALALDISSQPATGIAPLSVQPLASASAAQVQAAVTEALNESYAQTPPRAGESRHDLNRRLQLSSGTGQAAHYDGAEIVVIAFEGTGAFHPRRAPVMQAAAEKLRQQGLGLTGSSTGLAYVTGQALQAKEGQAANWSGLATGPLQSLLADPALQTQTQWLSFPSEEIEALARPDGYKQASVAQVIGEALRSHQGQTEGLNRALEAVREIQSQARAQGKNPQFVVVSHSSGGRSAVKFLELARQIQGTSGQPLHFPLVMTIDPVREAHEALLEAGKELINKGTEHNLNRVRGWFDALPLVELAPKKVYPPLVRHRSQPESLYAPANTGTFLNFFQRRDSEGLKLENPRFGIHGSPVAGAKNQEIWNVGSAGHGEITYHPQVTQAFVNQLQGLLKSD